MTTRTMDVPRLNSLLCHSHRDFPYDFRINISIARQRLFTRHYHHQINSKHNVSIPCLKLSQDVNGFRSHAIALIAMSIFIIPANKDHQHSEHAVSCSQRYHTSRELPHFHFMFKQQRHRLQPPRDNITLAAYSTAFQTQENQIQAGPALANK